MRICSTTHPATAMCSFAKVEREWDPLRFTPANRLSDILWLPLPLPPIAGKPGENVATGSGGGVKHNKACTSTQSTPTGEHGRGVSAASFATRCASAHTSAPCEHNQEVSERSAPAKQMRAEATTES